MSAVTTRSPARNSCAILSSAMSNPAATWMVLIKPDGGVRNGLLATSVNWVFRRSAARNRISLIGFGQASASTQMRMSALSQTGPLPMDCARARRGRTPARAVSYAKVSLARRSTTVAIIVMPAMIAKMTVEVVAPFEPARVVTIIRGWRHVDRRGHRIHRRGRAELDDHVDPGERGHCGKQTCCGGDSQ